MNLKTGVAGDMQDPETTVLLVVSLLVLDKLFRPLANAVLADVGTSTSDQSTCVGRLAETE